MTAFDPTKWRPGSALRCTVGISIPVIWANQAGHPEWGVLAALGALYAGLASISGSFEQRFEQITATAFVTSLLTWLGSMVSSSQVGSVVACAIVAFLLALVSGSGQRASSIALMGTGVMVVIANLPTSANPVGNAEIVLCGAMAQVVVLAAVWPFIPYQPEQRVLADVYEALARFTNSPLEDDWSVPDGEPVQEAWRVLTGSNEWYKDRERTKLVLSLKRAEAIRAALVGFKRTGRDLSAVDPEAAKFVVEDEELVATSLKEMAARIRHGKPGPTQAFQHRSPSGDQVSDRLSPYLNWRETVERCMTEPGEKELSGLTTPDRPEGVLDHLMEGGPAVGLAVRQAVRYGCAVGGSVLVGRVIGMEHHYWLPLTACICLRPDFATTIRRSLARMVGTMLGVLVSSAILMIPGLRATEFSWLMLGAAWIASATYLANYTLYAASLTLYVVFAVSASIAVGRATGVARFEATLAGIAIAVLMNFVWPIWQSGRVRSVLAEAFQSQLKYCELLAQSLRGERNSRGSYGGDRRLESTRAHARAARLAAEKIVHGAALEPSWGRRKLPHDAMDLLNDLVENAGTLLAFEAAAFHQIRVEGSVSKEQILELSNIAGNIQRAYGELM